jgi:hypothetical protein
MNNPFELLNDRLENIENLLHAIRTDATRPPEPEELLTREQTAKKLKIDLATLHRWSKAGKLKPVGIGHRVYYRLSELMESLQPLNT